MADLLIYYSSLSSPHYISCDCSRWSTDNYSVTVETWLTKSQLQTLREYITPGATDELYKILGQPTFYDSTWQGENTIKLSPITGKGSLESSRADKIVYIKNITDSPVGADTGYLHVKLETNISGSRI